MSKNKVQKFAIALFDDEDVLKAAVKHIQAAKVSIHDIFMPYPVHGIDTMLGMKRSRLPKAAFIFGLIGFLCGVSLIYYTNIYDWPMDVGGKPNTYPTVTFVPVCFELTVLCASFGMGFTFFASTGLYPGAKPFIFDERSTDDHFVVAIELNDNNTAAVNDLLKQTGAVEIKQIDKA